MTWSSFYGWCEQWVPEPHPTIFGRTTAPCEFRRTDTDVNPGLRHFTTRNQNLGWDRSTPENVQRHHELWICATHETHPLVFRSRPPLRKRRDAAVLKHLVFENGRWMPRLTTIHSRWPR